jgi:hypothetical protein
VRLLLRRLLRLILGGTSLLGLLQLAAIRVVPIAFTLDMAMIISCSEQRYS